MIMFSKFKQRLIDEYVKKKSWKELLIMLSNLKKRVVNENRVINEINEILDENINDHETIFKKFRIKVNFELRDELIYYIDEKYLRLCIFKSLKKKIFHMIHDDNHHFNTHRCFTKISKTMFIPQLLKKIYTYIKHCSACQMNQTKRHKSYDELMSVFIESQSFHTIIMNFIVDFFDKYNCLLIIIDKFSRFI